MKISADAAEAIKILRKIEWNGANYQTGDSRCPNCSAPEEDGHEKDCVLHKLTKKEEETEILQEISLCLEEDWNLTNFRLIEESINECIIAINKLRGEK